MAKKNNRANRKVVQMQNIYKDGKLAKKECPKCGKGVFLADHKNRISCGKCGYTEFNK